MIKQRIKQFLFREERGAAAVEGMIVLTLLIFFLVFLMSFGFLLYQQWAVVYTANDTATRIAQSYAYPKTDPVMGFVNSSMKASLSPYRYFDLFNRIDKQNEYKGTYYAEWSLENGSLSYAVEEPTIAVDTVYDAFAQRHVVVDVSATYEIPFGGALEFFGLDGTVTYHATGRAVCMDPSDYVFSVNTAKTLIDEAFDGKITGAIDSVLGLISSIMEAAED